MSLMLHEMLLGGEGSIEPLLFDHATSTTVGITYPAGIQAGDLIVLLDRASAGANPMPGKVVPAGYTQLSSDTASYPLNTSNRQRVTVSYRIATGPLTGNVNGQNGSVADSKVLFVFRKANGQPIASAIPTLVPSVADQTAGTTTASLTTAAGTFPANTFIFSAGTSLAGALTGMTQTASPITYGQVVASTSLSGLYAFSAVASPAITFTTNSNRSPSVITAAGLTIT